MGYYTADNEGNLLVMGLREISSKSGADTLSTFKEILQDIDDRVKCSAEQQDETSLKILLQMWPQYQTVERQNINVMSC